MLTILVTPVPLNRGFREQPLQCFNIVSGGRWSVSVYSTLFPIDIECSVTFIVRQKIVMFLRFLSEAIFPHFYRLCGAALHRSPHCTQCTKMTPHCSGCLCLSSWHRSQPSEEIFNPSLSSLLATEHCAVFRVWNIPVIITPLQLPASSSVLHDQQMTH